MRSSAFSILFLLIALAWASDQKSAAAAQGARQERQARPHPVLSALPANTARDLGPYQCTPVEGETPEQCRTVTDYSGMVYAPGLKSMVMLGGGHASTDYDAVNTFSMRTLNWKELYSRYNIFLLFRGITPRFTRKPYSSFPYSAFSR